MVLNSENAGSSQIRAMSSLFLYQCSNRFEPGEHLECFICGQLQWTIAISFETHRKFRLRNLIDDFDVFLVLFGAVEVLSNMNRLEVI